MRVQGGFPSYERPQRVGFSRSWQAEIGQKQASPCSNPYAHISTCAIVWISPHANGSKFNWGFYVEQGNFLGLKALKQASELFFSNCQTDLGWLISQLKKMRGMQFSRMSEAFNTGCQSGSTQPHFFGQIDKPVTEHFSMMTAVLLGKENHQKPFHD
ncbi:hypothetical protein VC35_05325 [Pseudomonas fluorescens]|uniref:Uncharacterized protein n=1 Tax=Pseudomonas fluorescens TaxID=294 RepID=A0A0F4U128_PSEFL|nr:hypothetical protein VC35_05325 [Pseudomonas fluorescens]